MKKVLTLLFVFIIGYCHAATGNANDGALLVVAVFVLMLLVIGIGNFISFINNKIKEFRSRRLIQKKEHDEDGEFLNSFVKSIPELDGISSY